MMPHGRHLHGELFRFSGVLKFVSTTQERALLVRLVEEHKLSRKDLGETDDCGGSHERHAVSEGCRERSSIYLIHEKITPCSFWFNNGPVNLWRLVR